MEQTSLTDLELPEVPDLSPQEKFAILRAYLRACRESRFRATDTLDSRVVIGDAGIVHSSTQSSVNSS